MTIFIIITIFIILILIAWYNLFVYFMWKKVISLEKTIITLFKIRTNQVVWIYQIAKDDLIKPEEIFKEFFELKRKDFWWDEFARLEDKLITYRRIHNEINFIFKTCEKHKSIQTNPIYAYIKGWIYENSKQIWENMKIYGSITEKYNYYKFLSHLTIIGYLY
jgi:hypothetical protein